VLSVEEGSILYKAGLRKDDVILGIDNDTVDNVDDILKPLYNFTQTQVFKLKISRAQNDLTLTIH